MKAALIMVLMAVVGLSSAYSLGDVYEKLQRDERDISAGSTGMSGSMSLEKVEKRDISGWSGSMSAERVEKRDISGWSGSMSAERVEKRDISGWSGSMSAEKIEKRDISGWSGSMSAEKIEKRDISGGSSSLESREKREAVSHDLDLRRLRRSASSGSGSYSIEE